MVAVLIFVVDGNEWNAIIGNMKLTLKYQKLQKTKNNLPKRALKERKK